jgi:hypothetical protein
LFYKIGHADNRISLRTAHSLILPIYVARIYMNGNVVEPRNVPYTLFPGLWCMFVPILGIAVYEDLD